METVDAAWSVLLNPIIVCRGVIFDLFGEKQGLGSVLREAGLPPEAYYAAVAVYAILFGLLLLNRYRRISA
jgi:hypothetical protein